MLLLPTLQLLTSASTIVARAISADSSSISDANTASLIGSTYVNSTIPGAECYDIRYCRTLEGLAQSCIVTILACVWFAVHRNIPAPRVAHPHNNLFIRALLFVWYKILDQRQALTVFVVTLLVPEWVLAWALRQFLMARRLAKELEEARGYASRTREAELSEGREAEKEFNESADDGVEGDPAADSSEMSMHDRLINRQSGSRHDITSRKCEHKCNIHRSPDDVHKAEYYDQLTVAERLAKANEETQMEAVWKIAHAFFIIMGGYHFYNKNGPCHPLSPKVVLELVRRGHLIAPTSDELANQSKGDALSKGVAIVQTLWFVMQCIARRIEHLPVTSLEVMTLAYTVITVAMYIVWWHKPLNISCAVRVPEEEIEEKGVEKYDSIGERFGVYIIGNQDSYVDLRECCRVPTFWAGDRNGGDALIADIIALLVAMVFGAVHCIAWSDGFRTPLEQQLWRTSTITVVAVPPALAAVLVAAMLIEQILALSNELVTIGIVSFYVPLALMYVAARLALIVISFTSLSILPVAAYQTVQWTTFVPHI
ncbi:hypothetical protein HWV62_10793 [Athelia sp. TMB]|nr:hypothetical protein HWV62_10793 [Athelia sp. TMB]